MLKRLTLSTFLTVLGMATAAHAVPVQFSYTQTDSVAGSGTLNLVTPITVTSLAGQTTLTSIAAPVAVVNQKDPVQPGVPTPAGMVGFVNVVDGTAPAVGSVNGVHLGWAGSVNYSLNDGIGNTFAVNVPLVLQTGGAYSYAISVIDDNSSVGGTNDAVSASGQVLAGYVGNDGSGHRHTQNGNSTYAVGPDAFVVNNQAGGLGSNANGDNLGISTVLRQSIGGATLYVDQVTLNATLQSNAMTVNGNSTLTQFNAAAGLTTIDIGASGQRIEPGAIGVTGPATGTNGSNLPAMFVSTSAGIFTVALDNVSQAGATVGGIDWRDRGDSSNGGSSLVQLGEDLVKNNGGIIRLTLGNLAKGTYEMTSYHLDLFADQTDLVEVFVDSGAGYVQQLATGDSSFAPAGNNVNLITTAEMLASAATFTFTSDGINPVRIVFDGRQGPNGFDQAALSGFSIRVAPVPEPATMSLLALGSLCLLRRRRAAVIA